MAKRAFEFTRESNAELDAFTTSYCGADLRVDRYSAWTYEYAVACRHLGSEGIHPAELEPQGLIRALPIFLDRTVVYILFVEYEKFFLALCVSKGKRNSRSIAGLRSPEMPAEAWTLAQDRLNQIQREP